MIFLLTLLTVACRGRAAPANDGKTNNRSGKFMRFGTADDLFSEVLDELHDPLSAAEDAASERPKSSIHNINPSTYHFNIKTDAEQQTDENVALNNKNRGKFKLITSSAGQFMLPVKPTPAENGILYYGGQQYQYRRPDSVNPQGGNGTGEIKIFWSSVTDAIEHLPFIPVQVNVPDMISAMANFLSTSIPIINRFTNPNHPRLPVGSPIQQYHQPDHQNLYQRLYNTVEDRELKNRESAEGRKSNKRKGQKRKNQKRKTNKGSVKVLPSARPFFKRTTEGPSTDKKVWHALGSGDPSGNTVKNMPISRRKFLVRDREVFNFKNSDIHNSPIMILNLPERPMMYHKTNINQRVGEPEVDGGPTESTLNTIWLEKKTTTMPRADNRASSKKAPAKKQKKPNRESGERKKPQNQQQ